MIKVTEQVKQGSSPETKEIVATIDNGDLELIDLLIDAYSFKDRESLIKFAIGTLLEGNNNEGIYTIKTDTGTRQLSKLKPSEDLIIAKKAE